MATDCSALDSAREVRKIEKRSIELVDPIIAVRDGLPVPTFRVLLGLLFAFAFAFQLFRHSCSRMKNEIRANKLDQH